jgi:hypothetical protein
MGTKAFKNSYLRSERSKLAQFGTSQRKVFKVNNEAPGPGSYQAPSAFGYYGSKHGGSVYSGHHASTVQSTNGRQTLLNSARSMSVRGTVKKKKRKSRPGTATLGSGREHRVLSGSLDMTIDSGNKKSKPDVYRQPRPQSSKPWPALTYFNYQP